MAHIPPSLAAALQDRYRLDHPHTLTLIDSGESGGCLWFVLPHIHGESLHRKRARLDAPPPPALREAQATWQKTVPASAQCAVGILPPP